MMRCEDWPCCGHELGCCPHYDESGRQTDMVCTCGTRLPVESQYSICPACLRAGDEDYDDDYDEPDQFRGTDEDYGDDYVGCEDYGDWGYDGCHEE